MWCTWLLLLEATWPLESSWERELITHAAHAAHTAHAAAHTAKPSLSELWH